MNKSSLEEQLKKYGLLTYRNVGVSMMPLLKQGRDLFTVRKKESDERAKKFDVVLYQRGNQYVLHRVLKVTEDGYIIRGDNCLYNEYVKEESVIAIMTEYVRKGKRYSVTDKAFINYTRRMIFFSPFRIGLGKIKRKIKKVVKNSEI